MVLLVTLTPFIAFTLAPFPRSLYVPLLLGTLIITPSGMLRLLIGSSALFPSIIFIAIASPNKNENGAKRTIRYEKVLLTRQKPWISDIQVANGGNIVSKRLNASKLATTFYVRAFPTSSQDERREDLGGWGGGEGESGCKFAAVSRWQWSTRTSTPIISRRKPVFMK